MTRINVDRPKLHRNFERIQQLSKSRGLDFLPVTKLVASRADILISDRFTPSRIADVHLENLLAFSQFSPDTGLELIKCDDDNILEIAKSIDRVFVSDIEICKLLNQSTDSCKLLRKKKLLNTSTKQNLYQDERIGVMLILESGDLRDGIPQQCVQSFLTDLMQLKNIRFDGYCINLGCMAGALPDKDELQKIIEKMLGLDKKFGLGKKSFSVGGTVFWDHFYSQDLPIEVSEIRLGEACFFAYNTSLSKCIEELEPEVFSVDLSVIESWKKNVESPKLKGMNAFGQNASLGPLGIRQRAVLAGGESIFPYNYLKPKNERCKIVGATHEYLVCDVEEMLPVVKSGDILSFVPYYDAVAQAFSSPYSKIVIKE